MESFWRSLPNALPAGRQAFFALAPMADVTDPAFRALIATHGKPDVTYTEFVSADGLYYTREVKKINDAENPLMRDLRYTEAERPIVMQVFSAKPEMIAYAAKLAEELRFDGFDINMGCPVDAVEKQGCGAALIKNPTLAQELVRAAKDATTLPVSLKTRIGFNTETIDEWLSALLETEPAAIAIHLRTRKEMSLVPAHWELMARAVELRDKAGVKTLMIGNGDVKDIEEAKAKAQETGADGVMLGRAIFGNPWLFTGRTDVSLEEKLKALIELAHAFEKLSPPKHFAILKKHIKAFVTGFDGAADLRVKLMEAENTAELEEGILEHHGGGSTLSGVSASKV